MAVYIFMYSIHYCSFDMKMVPKVRGSQGKLGNFKKVGKVGECKSTRVQKLTKMEKNFELLYADCVQYLKFFWSFRSQITCTSTF